MDWLEPRQRKERSMRKESDTTKGSRPVIIIIVIIVVVIGHALDDPHHFLYGHDVIPVRWGARGKVGSGTIINQDIAVTVHHVHEILHIGGIVEMSVLVVTTRYGYDSLH